MRSLHSTRSFSSYIESDNSKNNAVSPALSKALYKPQARQSVGFDPKQIPSGLPTTSTTTKKKNPIPRSATDTVKKLDEKTQSDKTTAINLILKNHVKKREQHVPLVRSSITRSSSFSSFSSEQVELDSTSFKQIDEVSKTTGSSIEIDPRYRRAALFNQTAIKNESPVRATSKSPQPSKFERLSDGVACQKDAPNTRIRGNIVNKRVNTKTEPSKEVEKKSAIESTTTVHPPKSPRSAYTRRAYASYATNSLTAELSCKLEKSTSSGNLTQDKPTIAAKTGTETTTPLSVNRRHYSISTFMNSVKSGESSVGIAQPHPNDNENSIQQSASHLGPLHRRKMSTSRPSSSKCKSIKADQTKNLVKKSDEDNSQSTDTTKTNISVVRYRGAAALSETTLMPKAIKLSSDHKLRRKDEMDTTEHSCKVAQVKVLEDTEKKVATNQSIKLFSKVGTNPRASKDEMDKSEHSRKLVLEKVLQVGTMEKKVAANQSIKLLSTVRTDPSASKDEMDKTEHSSKVALEKVLENIEKKVATNPSIKLFSKAGTNPTASNNDKEQNAVDTDKNKFSDDKTPEKGKRSIKYNVERGQSPAFLNKIYIAESVLGPQERIRQQNISLQPKAPSKSPSTSQPQRKSLGDIPSKSCRGTEHNKAKLDRVVALHRRLSFDSTFLSTSNHSSTSGMYDSLSKSSKHAAANICELKASPSLSSSRAKQYLGQPTPNRLPNGNDPFTPKQRYQQACLEHGSRKSQKVISMEPVSYTSLSTHCLSIVPCEQITSANTVPAISSERKTKATVQEMKSPCLENSSNRRGLTVTVPDDQSQMFCDKPIPQSPMIQNECSNMKSSIDLHSPVPSLEMEPPVRRFFSQSQRQLDGEYTSGEFDDTGIDIKNRPSSNNARNAAENRPADESTKSHNGNENPNYAEIVMKALLDGQERMEFSSSLNMISICGAPISTGMEPTNGIDNKLDDCIAAEKLAGIGRVTDSTSKSSKDDLIDIAVHPNDTFQSKKAKQGSKSTFNVDNNLVDNDQKKHSSIPLSIGNSSMGSWSDSMMSSLPAVDDVFRVKMNADYVDHSNNVVVDDVDDDEEDQDFSTMIDQLENEEVQDYLLDLTLSSITMTDQRRHALKLYQDGKEQKGHTEEGHEEKKNNFSFEDDKQVDENLNIIDGSAPPNNVTEESVAVAATETKTKVGGMISSLKNILKSGQRKETDIRIVDTNVIDCNSTISTKTTIDKNVYNNKQHCKERITENVFDTVTETLTEKSSLNHSNNKKISNNHHRSATTATLTTSTHTRTTTGSSSKPASMMKRFLIIGKGPKG